MAMHIICMELWNENTSNYTLEMKQYECTEKKDYSLMMIILILWLGKSIYVVCSYFILCITILVLLLREEFKAVKTKIRIKIKIKIKIKKIH